MFGSSVSCLLLWTLSHHWKKKRAHFGESNLCNHLSSLSKDFSSRVRRISGTTVSTAHLRVIGRLVRHSLDYFTFSSFSLSTHVDLLQAKCMHAGSLPWRCHMAEHWSSPLMKDLQHTLKKSKYPKLNCFVDWSGNLQGFSSERRAGYCKAQSSAQLCWPTYMEASFKAIILEALQACST